MSTQPPRDFPPSQPGYENQPPRKSNTLWWILGVVGVVLIGGGLLCCGGGYFAVQSGMNMAGQQVQTQIADDPAVVEHIGENPTVTLDLMETSRRGEPGKVVFKIEGSKGEGLLIGEQGPGNEITEMVLEMPDGETYPLAGEAGAVDAVDAVDEEASGDAEQAVDADANLDSQDAPPTE